MSGNLVAYTVVEPDIAGDKHNRNLNISSRLRVFA